MIGQAIFTAVFLVLAVMSLFTVQYCLEHDWIAPSVGFGVLAFAFGAFAFATLIMLGSQVWS